MKKFWHLTMATLGVYLLAGCGQPVKPVATTPTSGTPAGLVATPEGPAQTVKVKAGVGSGKAGRTLDQHEGIIVTPAKTLFVAKEKIKFEIEIPHALNLYKAYEGNAPKSHEEFMEKIIKANSIKLPELPEGHKYVYDPMTETLMVEKPAP